MQTGIAGRLSCAASRLQLLLRTHSETMLVPLMARGRQHVQLQKVSACHTRCAAHMQRQSDRHPLSALS